MFAFDRRRFLAEFSARSGVTLTPARQQALTFLLDSLERDAGFTLLGEIAYVLATIHWETGRTFAPVKELRASESRNPKLYARQQRYWPSGYYGRGYVQLTWDYNYKKASEKLAGEAFPIGGQAVTITPTMLLERPDYLFEPAISYRVAAQGMREGWFTGKRLSQYISAAGADYENARRIINGVDCAKEIAAIAVKYETLLTACQVGATPRSTGAAASLGTGRSIPPAPPRPRARAMSMGRSAPPPTASPVENGREADLEEGREADPEEGREAGPEEGREAGPEEGREAGFQEVLPSAFGYCATGLTVGYLIPSCSR
jgi:putative chitinase